MDGAIRTPKIISCSHIFDAVCDSREVVCRLSLNAAIWYSSTPVEEGEIRMSWEKILRILTITVLFSTRYMSAKLEANRWYVRAKGRYEIGSPGRAGSLRDTRSDVTSGLEESVIPERVLPHRKFSRRACTFKTSPDSPTNSSSLLTKFEL